MKIASRLTKYTYWKIAFHAQPMNFAFVFFYIKHGNSVCNTVKPPGMHSPFVRNSNCAHIFLFQLPCKRAIAASTPFGRMFFQLHVLRIETSQDILERVKLSYTLIILHFGTNYIM